MMAQQKPLSPDIPVISVIVPVYNVEKYLAACINSILAQTFADFELILVNDGSTDKSGQICEDYARQDARVRVAHQPNGGLSAARNTGINMARGDYLSFVDSDDTVLPDFLQALVRGAEESDADIALCGVTHVWENGDSPDEEVPPNKVFPADEALEIMLLYRPAQLEVLFGISCNKLFRRHLFTGLRYPPQRLFEDYHIILELYQTANTVACIGRPLYIYRRRGGSIMAEDTSQNGFRHRYERICLSAERLRFMRRYAYIAYLPYEVHRFWPMFYLVPRAVLHPPRAHRREARGCRKLLRRNLGLLLRHGGYPLPENLRICAYAFLPHIMWLYLRLFRRA